MKSGVGRDVLLLEAVRENLFLSLCYSYILGLSSLPLSTSVASSSLSVSSPTFDYGAPASFL
jgi:hypothetical protein